MLTQEYRTVLFEREGKKLIPTEACLQLIQRGSEILRSVKTFDTCFPNAVCTAKHLGRKDFVRFITIVEEGSFTKAAAKLFITQPAISQTIQKIEQNYKIELFTRENGRSVSLTSDGQAFFRFSVALLKDLDAIRQEICAQSVVYGQESDS